MFCTLKNEEHLVPQIIKFAIALYGAKQVFLLLPIRVASGLNLSGRNWVPVWVYHLFITMHKEYSRDWKDKMWALWSVTSKNVHVLPPLTQKIGSVHPGWHGLFKYSSVPLLSWESCLNSVLKNNHWELCLKSSTWTSTCHQISSENAHEMEL